MAWHYFQLTRLTAHLLERQFNLFLTTMPANNQPALPKMRWSLQKLLSVGFIGVLLSAPFAGADDNVYIDSLEDGWQNWSWSGTYDFSATDIAEGVSSISAAPDAWGALSLKSPTSFGNFSGLQFDVEGSNPTVTVILQSSSDDGQYTVPLSTLSPNITDAGFTTILINFQSVQPWHPWDRLSFQDNSGSGTSFHLDNIRLLTTIVVPQIFTSAEPLGTNTIALAGNGNASLVEVYLNGKNIAVKSVTNTQATNDATKKITYLELAKPFVPGNLTVNAGSSNFTYTIPASIPASIHANIAYSISPLVYGVNFPTDANYIAEQGVSFARWGGNAVTAYNPFGDFTNAGNDWYFENRASQKADDWLGIVEGANATAFLTVPALDWVAKDNSSYSYPKSLFPDQLAFDPYNSNAGDGQNSSGSYYPPPPQTQAYTPWNGSLVATWLKGLKNKPAVIAVDNEIEIASTTHIDMHPDPLGYDEILQRVINTAKVAKAALKGVEVAAPSTCAWYFYWRSAVGLSDTESHGGIDYLEWFLDQMALEGKKSGRLLDYLDIHYYPVMLGSGTLAEQQAQHLRATRSFYDWTYVDESWIGTTEWPNTNQTSPHTVALIPRFKQLIADHYPGTKLSLSEWSFAAETDIASGLAVADTLGIFGRERLDSATYWTDPSADSPVGLAFWLYRAAALQFASTSLKVEISTEDPDLYNIYAAITSKKKFTVVLINKDSASGKIFKLTGIPEGNYTLRHFGGQTGTYKYTTTVKIQKSGSIVVPAYTAVFLGQQ